MEDIHSYSLDAIYQMMKEGNLDTETLYRYIRDVVPNMESSEDLVRFLETANLYIDQKTKNGTTEETNKPEPVIKTEEEKSREIGEREDNMGQTEEEKKQEERKVEAREREERKKEEAEQQQIEEEEKKKQEELQKEQEQQVPPPVEEPELKEVPEEPKTTTEQLEAAAEVDLEEPEPVTHEPDRDKPNVLLDAMIAGDMLNDDYTTLDRDDPRLAAQRMMEETYKYGIYAGLDITEISLDGKGGRGPHISFELNNESKQYIENMMASLYNMPGISLELMRSAQTKQEFFTIQLSDGNMSQEQLFEEVRNTFETIFETIEKTRKDKDYQEQMPEGLKDWKSHFRNDDPDISGDLTIGYVKSDGKDTYYIVSDDPIKAEAYAREIGYNLKQTNGANVFEVETYGSPVNTKLEESSIDLVHASELYDIDQVGVSDLDIYGGLQQDPKVTIIEDFIETSNSPADMSMVEITIPPENPNQRVVNLRSTSGVNDTVVFTDGDNFDKTVLPKVADTYQENNKIEPENVTVTGGSIPGTSSCTIDSETNTQLVMNNYSEEQITETVNDMEKKQELEEAKDREISNIRQKSLGTYPTNTGESKAFVSVSVLVCVLCLFVIIIALLIFSM